MLLQKAFVIHVPGHTYSEEMAVFTAASSRVVGGLHVELFEGLTPETLANFGPSSKINHRKLSRAAAFYKNDKLRYLYKKSCSLNHYRLFKKCIELNEPIVILEQDALCVRKLESVDFDDILVLNATSAIKQYQLSYIHKDNLDYLAQGVPTGISDIAFRGLVYRHNPKINGAQIVPGTAAYAVTPAGAKKLVAAYETEGWEQSDLMINTSLVRIQVVGPEFFTFQPENLEMSHGPAKFSGAEKAAKKRTICEVHREIYDIVEKYFNAVEKYDETQRTGIATEIIKRLDEVYWMGKKMSAKLRQYKNNYDDAWWEDISKELYLQTLSKRSKRAKQSSQKI